MFKAKLDKTLHANVFNSSYFACKVICKQNVGYHEEGIGENTKGYGKMDAENIVNKHIQHEVIWEQSKGCDGGVLKAEVPQGYAVV